jgi:5-methylcytosine-specific restriction endonuclease McrA
MADSEWSQQEIDASVQAYLRMLSKELNGQKYNKAAVNRELREGALYQRSRGSLEMRMCNISAVLSSQNMPYIDGYKPRSNVGTQVTVMIAESLERFEDANPGAGSHSPQDTPSRPRDQVTYPDELPPEVIHRAIKRIDEFGITPHRDSTTYDVVANDKRYPPLAVVAFAIEEMTGKTLEPGIIRGGLGTSAFKLLANAGYTPVPKDYLEPTTDDDELEERVQKVRDNIPLSEQPPGNENPKTTQVTTTKVERDPQVKRWVLDNAEGVCELCGEQSPFKSKTKGHPWYLEVHHVIPLKDRGPDKPENAVALCPNCHMRCHHSTDADQATTELYQTVGRLKTSPRAR